MFKVARQYQIKQEEAHAFFPEYREGLEVLLPFLEWESLPGPCEFLKHDGTIKVVDNCEFSMFVTRERASQFLKAEHENWLEWQKPSAPDPNKKVIPWQP